MGFEKTQKNIPESRVGSVIKQRKVLGVKTVNSRKKYVCLCLVCNTEKLYFWENLRKQKSNHCGCLKFRTGWINPSYKHGLREIPEYSVWAGIIKRITNVNCKSYELYVTKNNLDIDPRWLQSFTHFYEDMGSRPSKQHTIERVNNFRGYWPDNCIWALRSQQNKNKSNNLYYTYKGNKYCLKELCTVLALKYKSVYMRIRRGHSDPFFGVENIEKV